MKKILISLPILFSLLTCEVDKTKIYQCEADLSLLSDIQFDNFVQNHLIENNLSFINQQKFTIFVEYRDSNVFVNAPEPNWDMFGYNIEDNYRYTSFFLDLYDLKIRLQIDKGDENTLWFAVFNVKANDWNPFEVFGSCAEVKAY